MSRDWILDKLSSFEGSTSEEKQYKADLTRFINNNKNCFSSVHPPIRESEAENEVGHITGSAWILNKTKDKVLLTHHRKLNKWLQLGGHSDGNANVLETALREAWEESGIDSIIPLSEEIFDIDIHQIKAKGDRPTHLHYDVRFLLQSLETDEFAISEESHDLKWVSIDEVEKLNPSESMKRMCRKWSD